MRIHLVAKIFGLLAILFIGASCTPPAPTRFCFENGICVEPDGRQVLQDGRPVCVLNNSCNIQDDNGNGGNGTDNGSGNGDGNSGNGNVTPPKLCTACGVTATDSDGDCIPDADENRPSTSTVTSTAGTCSLTGQSDSNNPDTDGDGILDGCEDANRNGTWDSGESVAWSDDSDCDGILDGIEDANKNGVYDFGELKALDNDSDGDGILDGAEDANRDGIVDPWVDADGCLDFTTTNKTRESNPLSIDSDGDGIFDQVEDKNKNGLCDAGETCLWHADTDCDLLPDGSEDENGNGVRNTTETDPFKPDTDNDGIKDGLEDTNKNGRRDPGETDPLLIDSDGDGIVDGKNGEDRNLNGVVDTYTDTNNNGHWDMGEPQGESDPRKVDSDGDGIPDPFEDRNQDGTCNFASLPNPTSTGNINTLLESCAFLSDTDSDGLSDGVEDTNRDGRWQEFAELDAKRQDTDRDQLFDGCPVDADPIMCEDKNLNGTVDSNETDPLRADTDGDGLTDGCEILFAGGQTKPLSQDSDGDGLADGLEDGNHNCTHDPTETDPRIPNTTPSTGTEAFTDWSVCGAQNLKALDFAQSSFATHDYQLAFEVEKQGVTEAHYIIDAFGIDNGTNGFQAKDPTDTLLGHVFQSPQGVALDASGVTIDRNIYGFVYVLDYDGTQSIDTYLDGLRTQLLNTYNGSKETGRLSQRPAHDNLVKLQSPPVSGDYPIKFAQRIYHLTTALTQPLTVRNAILTDHFVPAGTILAPSNVPPTTDPAYGAIDCTLTTEKHFCNTDFTLYVSAVHRKDQVGPGATTGSKGTLIVTVALTPNAPSNTTLVQTRQYNERISRLEDLTGGSALARSAAGISSGCDTRNQKMAEADLLWVVDDSGSMQSNIDTLQRAAKAAKAVLTANAGIIDFRVAMTTTNPSRTGIKRCYNGCENDCSGNSCGTNCDAGLGCYKACPTGCATNCSGTNCNTAPNTCSSTCFNNTNLDNTIASDAAVDTSNLNAALDNSLPGAGGRFYYEDTQFLDCDSGLGGRNDCSSLAYDANMSAFYGTNGTRNRYLEHAGFIGIDKSTSVCDTTPMSISSKASTPFNTLESCERLTVNTCKDGPTILASQMCNLIREMGGLPTVDVPSARPHSAPELGTRQARRLLQTLSTSATASDTATSHQLRRTCKSTDQNCSGTCTVKDAGCDIVPVVTLFLSDEEAFYFKDDCRQKLSAFYDKTQSVDHGQLPASCNWLDGDPTTFEPCTDAYCTSGNFLYGPPSGFNPDATARTSGTMTIQARDANAPECTGDTGSVGTGTSADPYTCGEPCSPQATKVHCEALTMDIGARSQNYCSWSNGSCVPWCKSKTNKATCNADSMCQWAPGQSGQSGQSACQNRYPLNDCNACKRFMRTNEALTGTYDSSTPTKDPFTGAPLLGFNDLVGPVYAIIRNRGEEGSGDTCNGGELTWGLGDGQAYRDLAAQTFGRTQDICAGDYTNFMGLVTADIAALSAPYPLTGSPIAATLKVGIARETAPSSGVFTHIDVPRSNTQGFFYNATKNTIAFKSDPIDGVCGTGSCPQKGRFETSEINYARYAETVPRAGDLIYISYRFWEPVPCLERCLSDESCLTVVCTGDDNTNCATNGDRDCPSGYLCNTATSLCTCTLNDLIDVCVQDSTCGLCETYNSVDKSCTKETNLCLCNPTGVQTCDPTIANSCPMGYVCDAGTCGCTKIPGCTQGFTGGTSMDACVAEVKCCNDWDLANTSCINATTQNGCSTASTSACTSLGLDNTTKICSGTSTTCNNNSECTLPATCDTECAHAQICQWDTGTCSFGYTTCCNNLGTTTERADCYYDGETARADLYCRTDCVCPTTCSISQVCELDPMTNACKCFAIGN